MVAVCDGLETCVHVSAGKDRHGSGSGAKPAEAGKQGSGSGAKPAEAGKKGSGSGSGSGAKPAAIQPAATKPAFSKPAAAGSGKSGKRGEETSDIELSSGAYSGQSSRSMRMCIPPLSFREVGCTAQRGFDHSWAA